MIRTSLKLSIALAALAGVAVLALASTRPIHAGPALQFDIDDWLAAQGTCGDIDADTIPCEEPDDLYVPPTRNFIGWTAPSQHRLGAVDYAGIAAAYLAANCDIDLGTSSTGSVTMRELDDGQALVNVRLHTRDALVWVADDVNQDFDFKNAPLLFGGRPGDVCAGTIPVALADVNMHVEYYTTPDEPLLDVGTFPPMRELAVTVHGAGELAAGGTAHVSIIQTGIFQPHTQSPNYDGFPAEFINLNPTGN
jgi:hypothetical protein